MKFLFLALLAGTLLPVQAAINATLRPPLGGAVWAAFASFFVGTVSLAIYGLSARVPPPQSLGGIAAWQWIGGLLGAVFVSLTIFLTPRIGTATLFGLIICGQLLASLMLDHGGWIGVPHHALNAPRVLGALFLLVGVFLIRKF